MLVADFAPGLKTDAENQHMIEEARRRINALPGVAATAFGMRIPFGLSGGGATHKVFVPELPATAPRGVTINFVPVSDHYFEVLGTRLLHGRSIDRQDVEGGARVMIVNQQFASRFWPNQDPLGRTVRLDRADGSEYQIIGLVEDGKYSDIQEDAKPYFFIPLKSYDYGEVSMVIKTSAASSSLISPVRQALRSVDNDVAILNLVTLREHMGLALYDQRVKSRLIAALGALGLALAAIGLYGLMAFLVSRRTREIGVRLALGSSRAAIFRLTLAQALRLGAIGVAIGSLAAVPATRLLRSMLVAVSPVDPIVFACAIFVLLFAAIVAALAPARNAVRIDPIKALRAE
jgi:predicted permease